ncbi:CMRF35-like molecule 5 [Hoplias malabaricus]|uniref:CMRF35-like molecule 5 n=1 Tax=Hoplias malabaricus TaxID=27720 RepID=UPI00346209E9
MTIKFLLIFSLYLISAGVNAVRTVTGLRGHSVQIHCPYESGYESYTKYLSRGECSTLPWSTKDIPVDSKSAKDQRFSLKDHTVNRVFIITITDLRTEDAGKYWCAIKRAVQAAVHDDYTEIQLLVKLVNSSVPETSAKTSTTATTSRESTSKKTAPAQPLPGPPPKPHHGPHQIFTTRQVDPSECSAGRP